MSKLFKKVTGVLKKAGPLASIASTFIPGLQPFAPAIKAITAASSLLGDDEEKQKAPKQIQAAQANPFVATRPDAMARPQALGDLASYAPEQERSALATKGLNQGLGDDEQAYYKNLVQRSLIGDGNKVTGSIDSLLPVEQQYFGQQGYNMTDINSFLQSLT